METKPAIKVEIEYVVRPVTRYIVIRNHFASDEEGRESGGSDSYGEYESKVIANLVANVLAEREGAKAPEPLVPPSLPKAPPA